MKKEKDPLCLTDLYDTIKEVSLIPEDYEENKRIDLTPEELYLSDQFSSKHYDCRVLPDGRHRFGTIGGGFSERYYMSPDGNRFEVVAKCHGCNETYNISKAALEFQEWPSEEVKAKYIEKAEKNYSGGYFSVVEYLRYLKFKEDRPGHTISVEFMGTGLGYLISIRDEETGEYADITDTSCW